ncbi:MAG TPA: GNAT family N-acetyltransferase [Planctomycetaceae bacterium]|nr:GNAT family N-acetyltransferase [Planctomycetaceae bacterium]
MPEKSMLQLATYHGTVEELAAFINGIWADCYAGKMTYPCWTPEYFTWQLRLDTEASHDNLVAAYDGDRLVGVLLGTRHMLRSPAGVHPGSQWSWLSVDAEYEGRGIAKMLHQERMRREQAAGSRLIVSYRFVGSSHSKAERPEAGVRDRKFNRNMGFWIRVLDPARFSNWHLSKVEGFLARLSSPLAKIPTAQPTGISVRAFADSDLDACLELVRGTYPASALSIEWNGESLRHQLFGHPISQTLVLEENHAVTGFVNFHVLPFQARTRECVALMDMIVRGNSSSKGYLCLMNAALGRMKEQGAVLALKLRCADTSASLMFRNHFVPPLPELVLVLQSVDASIEIPARAPVQVLWR